MTTTNEIDVLGEALRNDVAIHEGCGSRDRNDYQRFLSESGITEEAVRAVTESGELFHLPMGNIEIRRSERHGDGLFAKQSFFTSDVIAPALLDGQKTEAGRYTNHSGKPNAKMVVRDASNIDLVATKEIQREEITTDYRDNLRVQGWKRIQQ